MTAPWVEVIAAVLRGAPSLPGARCKGRPDIWDEVEHAEIREYATNQCLTCPALQPCRTWVDTLKPSQRPIGVIAGEIRYAPAEKKHSAA